MLNSFTFQRMISGRVDQLGMIATLASSRSGVQIPARPPSKISDYLIEVDPEVQGSELDYQQALIVAMKKEKAAFKLYTNLAEHTEQQEYRHLFRALAQEEAKHKLRFEIEYDEQFLTEN